MNDDVVVKTIADEQAPDGPEFELAPPDGLSECERAIRWSPLPPVVLSPQPERFQFSLLTILFLTFFAAIGLAGHNSISPPAFAGTLGLVVLFCLMWSVVQPPKSYYGLLALWGLILAYVSAIVAALAWGLA